MQDNIFLAKKLKTKFLTQELSDFDSSMPQNILDIEGKTRSNIFAWRGQFSPQLIENLLLFYCPKNATVLDPFAGSGTVLYESACLGLPVFGCEVNPAAWILNRTYKLINFDISQRQELINSVKNKLESHFQEPKLFDLSSSEQIDISEFRQAISSIYEKAESLDKIILDTLIILLDLGNKSLTIDRIYNTFFNLCQSIKYFPYSEAQIINLLCDARHLSIETNSIDFVVTSPPYINVFNYHQNYRISAEILGWDLLKIAKSEIGSNRANRANRFLTVTQYCLDIVLVFKEIQRVCILNSRIIFIVGYESNVLGVPFYNSEIISKICKMSEVFELLFTQKRNFKNKFGKVIREDLLHLVNKDVILSTSEWEQIAQKIAYLVLTDGLQVVSDQNKAALLKAIEKVYIINKSPIYNN